MAFQRMPICIVVFIEFQMSLEDERQIQLQVQCREGPIRERSCTDWGCCLLYVLLLAAVVVLAVMASSGQIDESIMDRMIKSKGQDLPFMSIKKSSQYILISLGIAVALCVVIVLTIYMIPAIAAYLFIPMMLLLMLLLGVGFVYRYFGNRLPFVPRQIQHEYAATHQLTSLLIGVAFLVGFIASLVVALTKQQRIRFIFAMLKLAKICFWDNSYIFIVSFLLSVMSIAVIVLNFECISMSLRQVDQNIVYNYPYIGIVLFQILWTHGFIQAYSDFLYQAIPIFWYYNEAKHKDQYYSSFLENFCPSLGLSFRHMGTIIFGSVLTYYPDWFNSFMNSCEERSQGCYRAFCYCHKLMCQNLSKYCYIGTIMYGHSFCRANHSIRNIRATAKHTFPQLYMIGGFFVTLMKIFIMLFTIITAYFLIVGHSEFRGNLNYVAPLLVVVLASFEIANHFMNATGVIGDAIYLIYVIDFNCETTNFGNLNADHCPKEAYTVINEAKISRYATYD